ncbi:GxxExxY protein [Oleiharenicola lentus]|uniref:GxxExxY protein n=1 Tax=Oleiharenicola lentus TaxID=2508720 RepID=UPI003F66DAC7
MDTNAHEEKWLHGDLVYQIVGCALEVSRELGHGLHEKPYENAMVVEMGIRGLTFDQQQRYDVMYKGIQVSEYVPDLVVGGSVVVDSKVIEHITDHERGQMLNYLRITKLRVGLIINFKKPRLEWERVIL